MSLLRRSKSEPALDPTVERMQTRQPPSFQFSIPYNRSQVVDGKYVSAPYGYRTYTTDDRGRICLRCLRWSLTTAKDSCPSSEAKEKNIRLVEKWGSPVEMIKADCPMCRLFAMHAIDYQFINGPMEGRLYDLRELRVERQQPQWMITRSPSSLVRFWYLDPNSAPRANFPQPAGEGACIGVTDLTAVDEPGKLRPVLLDANAVDYSSIQSWLSECRLHHGETCSFKSTEDLPSLRLIDCLSVPPRVVEAPALHEYVALSYVWGSGAVGSQFSGDTLIWSLLPRTIRDAMTVTRKLGYRYLWVDRYCIPKARLQEQISKMDIIYTNPSMVIIAAAGDTIEFGLPGVGTRQRAQQPYALVGKDAYVSTLADLNSIMHTIPWSKRAWCFQEALLSQRRLIFTDDKTYFFCRQMMSIETLSLPFYNLKDRPHTSRVASSTIFYDWLVGSGVTRNDPQEIYPILSEYASKDMTYESDGLNAIVGVLRAFSKANHSNQFHSYAGLPILGPPSRKAFLTALLWSPNFQKKRRSGDFPSWSWIGWTGSFRYNEHSREIDKDVQIRLVEEDGSTMDWDEFVSAGRLKYTLYPLSQYIELCAKTTLVQVTFLTTSSVQYGGAYFIPVQRFPEGKMRYAQVTLNYGISEGGKLNPELHAELIGSPMKCLLLISPDNERKLYGNGWLLRSLDGFWEQVGSFQLDYIGNVYDRNGNVDSFMMDTDPGATMEGFSDLEREWLRVG
ncbi:hypothetical protein H2200_007968 [Cladophialophora chaetospira]|uniref:Heterokaryon incompatibility domain-containing protein n=1 Tax=Cladophialophora chaetospira TaxID=386627 RepID=A0AA39CGX5_9EURO|nr:hypothetical protein H2200_007968 [Cladophialophora chaetospira]